MKYAKWISALILCVPLVAAAQMKPTDRIVTQVPFKFMVGAVEMPAGDYTVQLADRKAFAVLIANHDAKLSTFALAVPSEDTKTPSAALVFHKYGDRYFLAELKVGDSRTAYAFRPGKLEKELRAQNSGTAEEILLASR